MIMESVPSSTGRALTRSSPGVTAVSQVTCVGISGDDAPFSLEDASAMFVRVTVASRVTSDDVNGEFAPRRNHSVWAGMDAGPRGDVAGAHRGARASQGAPGQTRTGVDSGFGVTFVRHSAPNPPTSPNPPGNRSVLVLGSELRDGCGQAAGVTAESRSVVAEGRLGWVRAGGPG